MHHRPASDAVPPRADVVVLGTGPAGLGAALALTRAGVDVTVLEATDRVGGMCVTDRFEDFAFDLGGHILFVHDALREAWLRELLGPDLVWVDRPVAHDAGGEVRRGRYFDVHGPVALTPHDLPAPTVSAAAFLDRVYAGRVHPDLRHYLEKVDGIPLERITATRARKLLVEQYAPDGFWYAAHGVGQLMDAMARAIRAGGGHVVTGARITAVDASGGRVRSVSGEADEGVFSIATDAVVAGVPAGLVAPLVTGAAATDPPALPARAAAVVSLTVDTPRVTDEPWIQVADPTVPFARLAEPRNWSARMAPPDRTLVSCEVYCSPTDDDPWWPRSDDDLADRCCEALVGLGLVTPAAAMRSVSVARRARAWTVVDVDHVEQAQEPARTLSAVEGLVVAQGGDVVQAVEAGERSALALLAAR